MGHKFSIMGDVDKSCSNCVDLLETCHVKAKYLWLRSFRFYILLVYESPVSILVSLLFIAYVRMNDCGLTPLHMLEDSSSHILKSLHYVCTKHKHFLFVEITVTFSFI